jgi:hypothetical protein
MRLYNRAIDDCDLPRSVLQYYSDRVLFFFYKLCIFKVPKFQNLIPKSRIYYFNNRLIERTFYKKHYLLFYELKEFDEKPENLLKVYSDEVLKKKQAAFIAKQVQLAKEYELEQLQKKENRLKPFKNA